MPVTHKSDKKPDGSPIVLHRSSAATGFIFSQVGHDSSNLESLKKPCLGVDITWG